MGKPKPKTSGKGKAPKRKPAKRTCKTVVDRKTRKKRKVCTTKKAKPKAKARPKAKTPVVVGRPGQPTPSAAAPPVTTGLPGPGSGGSPAPAPPPGGDPGPQPGPGGDPGPGPGPVEQPGGLPRQPTFGPREAERLLWRAGFGPRPGEAAAVAQLGLEAAVHALTRPQQPETFTGAAPVDANGDPYNRQRAVSEYGGDVVWWFDRMVRTTRPLAQRMALIWHDWFAVANRQIVGSPRMLKQYDLFHARWLGNFRDLALDVTVDEAMLVFLNGLDNERTHPNENYGRELMELFTLGADRGAYTETDVRELARVLTGYTADWSVPKQDLDNFRFVAARHDPNPKTLWAGTAHARTGPFGWRQGNGRWECDAVDLCLQNPFHPSFFVRKLWSYFVPSDPPAATQQALERLYVDGGYEVRPVVEAILMHPDLYSERRLVKTPAVFAAGLLRSRNETVRQSAWDGVLEMAGQRLFDPPDVAGWRDQAWLDTNTLLGRSDCVALLLRGRDLPVDQPYPWPAETPAEAVARALAYWNDPWISAGARAVLEGFAADVVARVGDPHRLRAQRMNALRLLVAVGPDHQTC